MIICIVIPAHNEASVLGAVIDDLHDRGLRNIVVVDDGSTDSTSKIAGDKKVAVLTLPYRKGQGAALQAGFLHAQVLYNPDIIVTFDADGQHLAHDIASLVRPIVEKKYDIVLGSRFLGHESVTMPASRRTVLRAGIVFTRWMTGLPVTDTHNGLRALHKRAFENLVFIHKGYAHAFEFFDMIATRRLRWCEVPVTVLYSPAALQKGQKNYEAARIAWQYIFHKIFR